MESITTYNYIGNKVIMLGHEIILAAAEINGCLVFDEFIILLLDPHQLCSEANVYCYNIEGKLIWIISEGYKMHSRNYYTSIYVLKDWNLYAYSINGIENKIDFKTGKILASSLIN